MAGPDAALTMSMADAVVGADTGAGVATGETMVKGTTTTTMMTPVMWNEETDMIGGTGIGTGTEREISTGTGGTGVLTLTEVGISKLEPIT